MPGRQAHGRALLRAPKPTAKKNHGSAKAKRRGADAFAIASKLEGDNVKMKRHRMGVVEDNRPTKRRRAADHEEDDTEPNERDQGEHGDRSKEQQHHRGQQRNGVDAASDRGSDSEGNTWKMGHVEDDDDSEIDSDEAFGESDEEKFGGLAFRGSSGSKKLHTKPKATKGARDLTLDEDSHDTLHGADMDSDMESDDLGEDAIDLAAMLDATAEESDKAQKSRNRSGHSSPGAFEDSESLQEESSGSSEDDDVDDESLITSSDDDDDDDPSRVTALQKMIANLPHQAPGARPTKQNGMDSVEHRVPSSIGAASKTKLTLEDLALPSIQDPHIKASLKMLVSGDDARGSLKTTKKLDVPLARRQQDRLDRAAAYEKTKETLSRWTDTVANNRRADHLQFPLRDLDTASAQNNSRLQPTGLSKPFNDLESTIQSIMEESGLGADSSKNDDDHLRELEAQNKQPSLEDVQARRNQLRLAREALYREETKAKRIKKIKSKSYRRVHRKQREKEERIEKDALIEGGYVPSEDEQEAQDRRRAEERMGQRHRGSKWAKAAKMSGRAAWDDDARAGITELARRDEELRKRVDGKISRNEAEADRSDNTSDDHDDSNIDLVEEVARLQSSAADTAPKKGLANMKFMLKAEEGRRKANDMALKELRQDLEGRESSEEAEDVDIGRRAYGPKAKSQLATSKQRAKQDFEEPMSSGNEDGHIRIDLGNQGPGTTSSTASGKTATTRIRHRDLTPEPMKTASGGAWSRVADEGDGVIANPEARRRRHKNNSSKMVEELDLSKATVITKPFKKRHKATTTLEIANEESSDDEQAPGVPFAIQDPEMIKRAFAGADVVGEFESEKKQVVVEDDDKVIDNTLPGWGNWVGDNVSKKDKRNHHGRFLTKVAGVKASDRQDAKLDRVIISEKRVKKNVRYLASSLPHPFETRQQYERSLRLPVGPEWATKETFQEATKPRIIMKQGIIAPMSTPLF